MLWRPVGGLWEPRRRQRSCEQWVCGALDMEELEETEDSILADLNFNGKIRRKHSMQAAWEGVTQGLGKELA